jgi:hypothetical protein
VGCLCGAVQAAAARRQATCCQLGIGCLTLDCPLAASCVVCSLSLALNLVWVSGTLVGVWNIGGQPLVCDRTGKVGRVHALVLGADAVWVELMFSLMCHGCWWDVVLNRQHNNSGASTVLAWCLTAVALVWVDVGIW